MMKKTALLLMAFLPCLAMHAEHSQNLSHELSSGQSHHFIAADHIQLSPGFYYEPKNGNEALMMIDPFDVTPPALGVTGGPHNGDNGVVGALKGAIDVSTLGAATYTIPIELPMGLGKLCPTLGIYYNNQHRNGLLGWNWDLVGISSISRAGGNRYYDGYASAVNYTDDRFCLDGQRLLKVSTGDYGGNEVQYRTEQDQMSKIVSYTSPGFAGPSHFKVWTADGKILCYGNSTDTKALVSQTNNVNVWLLKSIEDHHGNKITYHYQNNADSYRLTRIDYSENQADNIDATLKVYFIYATRNDAELQYHGDCLQKKDALLQRIVVKVGNNQLSEYRFEYRQPDPQNGYPHPLLTSIGYAMGDQHLNPTIIEWADNNYAIPMVNSSSIPVSTTTIASAFSHAVKFSGDFNGDGHTDVLAVRANLDGSGTFHNQADLFLNKGVNNSLNFDYVRSFNLNMFINWIYVADFNGDGRDDILLSYRQRGLEPLPDIILSTVYLSIANATGDVTFSCHDLPEYNIKNDLLESLLIGDFFGEGRQSILIQSLKNNRSDDQQSILIRYDDTAGTFQPCVFQEHLAATRFYPADYNGDGATEILYKNQQGYTSIARLTMENGAPHYSQWYRGEPHHWDDCFPGDFNGDGHCDLLFYKHDATQPWFINLSHALGINTTRYPLPSSFPYDNPGYYYYALDMPNETYHFIKVADVDGNGCADIVLQNDNQLHIYQGPINLTSNDAPFTSSRHLSTQLVQYFSNMDLCIGNFLGKDNVSFLGNYSLSHLPPMAPRHEVKSITDGMGRKTALQYEYLMPNPNNPSTNDFYYLQTSGAYPASSIYTTYVPLRALKKATTYNINNKPETVECQYQGALLHRQGKGFLGFNATIQKDYCNGQLQKRTVRHYDVEFIRQVIHPMMLEEQTFDKEGRLMADTWCSNRIYTNTRNSKVFIPIADKTVSEYDIDQPERLIKKEIHETVVETHTNEQMAYNKTISVTQQMKGVTSNANLSQAGLCEFLRKTLVTYYADIADSWLINRPRYVNEIHHRTGNYADICRSKEIRYTNGKPYQVASVIEKPNNDVNSDSPLVRKTEYQYDLTGNIISQTISAPNDDLPSRTTLYEYDRSYGRRLLTKQTDPEGQATTFSYHPVYGHRTSMTDNNRLVTYYERDPMGMTLTTTHPDGTVTCQATRWGHDGYYQWEKKTGQPTKTTDYALTGEKLRQLSYTLNGEPVSSSYEYDDFGRVKKETMPHGEGSPKRFVTIDYDAHHRVRRINHNDGTFELMNYDGNSSTATFHTTDNQEQSTSKTVNVMGWVVKSTDALGTNVIYDYNPEGKPLWTQVEGMEETRISMGYDGFGHRTTMDDPDYGFSTDEYNAFGELTRQVTPNFLVTEYTYDKLGNKTRRVESDHGTGTPSTTRWDYGTSSGSSGLLSSISSDIQSIRYEYDDLMHLVTVNENRDGNCFTTRYAYDKASRVKSITYPSGYTVHYDYTSEGQLRRINDDNATPLWQLNDANAMGVPTQFTTGNGFVATFQYDPSTDRLRSIKTLNGTTTIQDYSYDYDELSNMTRRTDHKGNHEETFSYDPLNRLVSAVDADGESRFTYDPLGRMTGKTQAGNTVFSNAVYTGPMPHAIKSAQSPPGSFPQERMEISYTPFGKTESITEGNRQVTYRYGYDHQRILATENIQGQVRNKVYVNNCEFITIGNNGSVTRTFLSGPTGVFAVAETVNGTTSIYYIHKDHLGSWTVISDSQGKVCQENRFDAWGNSENNDSLWFDRGFTGHEHIKGMNLINMDGRLYDPVTSSMISPDNHIQLPDNSQSLNRYAYAFNNPLTYVDPDGNTAVETALILYLLICTDIGYELQKEFLPVALHLDFHLSTEQIGLGMDVSAGVPKSFGLSVRLHAGLTYYQSFYDNSFSGWEFRTGAELCLGGILGVTGTTYYFDGKKQTTNTVYVGNYLWRIEYENDFMFNLCNDLIGFPAADNGDRYRSAAAKVRVGFFSVGANVFTGDPGQSHADRNTYIDPSNGRETYTIGANGEDPDAYRAGVIYVGFGPVRIGANSEQIRHCLQNRFAHDFLCRKDSPYFKVLDRPGSAYFYFGSGTGDSLW